MAKSIEQQFRKLTEVEHALARPGRYIGSVNRVEYTGPLPAVTGGFDSKYDPADVVMTERTIDYVPAFLKMFDEIITNSADHSRRPEGAHLDTIRVNFDRETGEIVVFDNGGIPVVMHSDANQWLPEMLFGELRAGSNFDDSEDQELAGQNGEGAALTNIFSTKFIVETCDGKQKYRQVFENNSRKRGEPKITPAEGEAGYTRITYYPDWAALNISAATNGMTEDSSLFTGFDHTMLIARTYEIAAVNTHLKIYINGTRVLTKTFKDYVKMFTGAADMVYDENDKWKVAIGPNKSNDFSHLSFVNATRTKVGGEHITYVINQIVDGLRELIKKKHKIEIKPADLRNHMTLYVDARIVNPRYEGQVKDKLLTTPPNFKTSWTVPEKFLRALMASTIVKDVVDWAEARAKAAELLELKKKNKEASKANPKHVDKFTDALNKDQRWKCSLIDVEGDSARNSILSARGSNQFIGSFALRGKPLNVHDEEIAKIVANKELSNILTVTGLQLGVKVKSPRDLRFGRFITMTDADLDGNHIGSLMLGFYGKYWPELFGLGMCYIFQTPIYIARWGKDNFKEFLTEEDYEAWAKTAPKHKADYYKGLGGFDTEDFARFLENMDDYLVEVKAVRKEDEEALNLAFNGKFADERKDWLEGINYFKFED